MNYENKKTIAIMLENISKHVPHPIGIPEDINKLTYFKDIYERK